MAIIVPLLNELAALPGVLKGLNRLGAEQLIFVDGGSKDGSYEWLQKHVTTQNGGNAERIVLRVKDAGRARQMNAGAARATADILLFLHADTQMPDNALEDIRQARWGRFDVAFSDNRSPYSRTLAVVEYMINLRSRLSGVATGDQAIFVQRALFEQVGGFAAIPIMEDVALSKKLKRVVPPYCAKLRVQTSARRWKQHGIWRTILLMWALRLAYALGVSPKRLQRFYKQVR